MADPTFYILFLIIAMVVIGGMSAMGQPQRKDKPQGRVANWLMSPPKWTMKR